VAKIGIDKLNEGMIVDEPVNDLHGTILMQKGTVITPTGIKVLKMWGVLHVSIDDTSAAEHLMAPEQRIDPYIEKEAKREVDALFQQVDRSNFFIKELMCLATARIAKTMSERGYGC
jgi:hypothetical protein